MAPPQREQHRLTGSYQGADGVFGRLRSGPAMLVVEPQHFLAADEVAVALVRVHGEHQGRHLDISAIHAYVVRDGRIVESRTYFEDSRVMDRFIG
ncbi:nuclear transport factor 2 family protein [Nonomuraea sp. NPDC050404]|uniref:nuclear transport factor 2 family protein n=1 Tax=Nonomuraea sp. NPDC050404 TaxID=3155783 RepID=UPI0033C0B922